MKKEAIYALLAITMALLLSGCVSRELVISNSDLNRGGTQWSQQPNQWAEQTNVVTEEDVDISDLDENITQTETPLMISEEGGVEKMERMAFPVGEYQRLSHSGKGTIHGKIYLKDAYGKEVVGARTRLYLNPKTSYSDQWYNESYLGGYKMQKADARLFNYLRFTASDEKGNFAFYGVPSGEYYLIGTVKCGSECGYDVPHIIRIATRVYVSGNQVIEKDLTKVVQ
jgi:hypothetical protein